MSEKSIQVRVILKGVVILVCASLYAWGGMEMKWLRRFLAPAIFAASYFYFTRDWRIWLQMPLVMASMTLGYGGVGLVEKIARRLIWSAGVGISMSIVDILHRKWIIVGIYLAVLVLICVAFGVFNPFVHARTEEFVIGMAVYSIPMLSGERA